MTLQLHVPFDPEPITAVFPHEPYPGVKFGHFPFDGEELLTVHSARWDNNGQYVIYEVLITNGGVDERDRHLGEIAYNAISVVPPEGHRVVPIVMRPCMERDREERLYLSKHATRAFLSQRGWIRRFAFVPIGQPVPQELYSGVPTNSERYGPGRIWTPEPLSDAVVRAKREERSTLREALSLGRAPVGDGSGREGEWGVYYSAMEEFHPLHHKQRDDVGGEHIVHVEDDCVDTFQAREAAWLRMEMCAERFNNFAFNHEGLPISADMYADDHGVVDYELSDSTSENNALPQYRPDKWARGAWSWPLLKPRLKGYADRGRVHNPDVQHMRRRTNGLDACCEFMHSPIASLMQAVYAQHARLVHPEFKSTKWGGTLYNDWAQGKRFPNQIGGLGREDAQLMYCATSAMEYAPQAEVESMQDWFIMLCEVFELHTLPNGVPMRRGADNQHWNPGPWAEHPNGKAKPGQKNGVDVPEMYFPQRLDGCKSFEVMLLQWARFVAVVQLEKMGTEDCMKLARVIRDQAKRCDEWVYQRFIPGKNPEKRGPAEAIGVWFDGERNPTSQVWTWGDGGEVAESLSGYTASWALSGDPGYAIKQILGVPESTKPNALRRHLWSLDDDRSLPFWMPRYAMLDGLLRRKSPFEPEDRPDVKPSPEPPKNEPEPLPPIEFAPDGITTVSLRELRGIRNESRHLADRIARLMAAANGFPKRELEDA